MKRLLVIALLCLTGIAYADEPQARFSLERGSQPHAGMPFKLILAAAGFDQSPAPEQPKLTIANATVTPLGASPNVSQSIEIVNGRQSVTSTKSGSRSRVRLWASTCTASSMSPTRIPFRNSSTRSSASSGRLTW